MRTFALTLFVVFVAAALVSSGAGLAGAVAVACVLAVVGAIYLWLSWRQRQRALREARAGGWGWPAAIPNSSYRGRFRGRRPEYPAALFLGRLTLTRTQAHWVPSPIISRRLEEQTFVPTGPVTVRSRWGIGQVHDVTLECNGEPTHVRLWFANDFARKASEMGWRLLG